MIINIGSKNPVKINAVKDAFSYYFKDIIVKSIEVKSIVSHTPLSSKDAVKGAKNRAKAAFKDCDYSVGIEGALIEYPTPSGYILTAAIVIYDGKEFHMGGSPLLNLPKHIVNQVLDGKELGPLFDKITGIPDHKKHMGAVGFLTKEVIPRQKALETGVILALCSIINKDIYNE